ncbi:hypothetical protein LTR95_005423 [Oleoguttula sp. CCFEE 5521]
MAGMFSSVKLPWHSSTNEAKAEDEVKQSDEEGESLVTVLRTAEDRSALTILVADCTALMRQDIVAIFDAKQVPPATAKPIAQTDQGPDVVKQTASDDAEKAKQDLAAREKEIASPKMQELRKAALTYFDEWRASVIQRVGEIVNSKQQATEQAQQSKPKTERPRSASPPMRFPKAPEYDPSVKKALEKLYPPVENNLTKFPEAKRTLILHSMLLLLLSLEHYKAQSRTLMMYLTTSLHLPPSLLSDDESKIARGLLTAAENMKADEETKKKAEENTDTRKWKVGLATVAGAALIGVTGGLAAPLLAAGVGSVMGGLGLGATAAAGYLGSMAASSVLVGGLFGAYGGRMTGRMMDQYAREVEDFAFVAVRTYHRPRKIEKESRRLRVAIGISGWLTDKDDVVEPWRVIGTGMESFALRFELEALMNLGNSLTSMLTSAAWGYAKKELIKRTVFGSLLAGLWPLGLLKVSRIVDNPWSVASHRATRAGEVLADAIINKAQGERPVTLIGYSLGARVIYTCLQRLAERKAFGLVEQVVFMGAPCPSTSTDWRMIRSVTSGRVVNVYSSDDYILAFLYRSSSIQYGVAGLQAIEGVKGVENFDISDMVSGHTSYRFLTGRILQKIGFEDIDKEEFESEEKQRKEEEVKAQKELQESQAKEDSTAGTTQVKEGDKDVSDQHIKDLEKEIEDKNQQSYIGWATEKMTLAGTGASAAYEKAKLQWAARGQTAAAGGVAEGTKDTANKHVSGESYDDVKARAEARRLTEEMELGLKK